MTTYSIILPTYNEEENIKQYYAEAKKVLKLLSGSHEFIFINDGSFDHTQEILESLCKRDCSVKIINFSRNFGHQSAITAGLDHARGEYIAISDVDMQDPPSILPTFFAKLKEGYDVVYAIRTKRKEGVFKRVAYNTFYRLLQRIAEIYIPLDSGDFCVMTRRVVEVMRHMPERNRFVRGIRSWTGFAQTGLAYEREARFAGEPQYTFSKLLKLALDGILSFSYVPLRLLTIGGFLAFLISIGGTIFAFYLSFFTDTLVPGFATTVILIMFSGGLNMLAVGILGEYVARIYDEVKGRPPYVIESTVGFK